MERKLQLLGSYHGGGTTNDHRGSEKKKELRLVTVVTGRVGRGIRGPGMKRLVSSCVV